MDAELGAGEKLRHAQEVSKKTAQIPAMLKIQPGKNHARYVNAISHVARLRRYGAKQVVTYT